VDHDIPLLAGMQEHPTHTEPFTADDGTSAHDFIPVDGAVHVQDPQGLNIGSIHTDEHGATFTGNDGHPALRLDHDTVYDARGLPTEHLLHYGNTTDIYDSAGHQVGSIVRLADRTLTFKPGFPPSQTTFS